ncbi:hypothetical protein N0V84_010424 [Fusarium piperis]|uniref:DUF7730 domain-containing protein n=1 Tax=Fusarium piperis TaxID=1435070 RepID=A0A9W8W4N1_9HYPO|nr:hypothetical protein N0V84_010424 [Fusarium piperis]
MATLTTTRSTQSQLNPQTQSKFFTILTEDIRYRVFLYLFGRVTVEIDFVYTGFCDHFICLLRGDHNHASLLRTCQRAYMEGICVLYSTNVFKSKGVNLDRLRNKIHGSQWDLIRKVDLCISTAADLYQWEAAWDTLCSMPGLQSARLRCDTEMKLSYDPSGTPLRVMKDPLERGTFYVRWALNPILRASMNAKASFEILFNVERRLGVGILIKELRAREVRGIRIGWVSFIEKRKNLSRKVHNVIVPRIGWEEV